MILFESIKLSGFRNFDDESIHFVPGTNVILGQNGHGKSNLLEAIYLICTGRSFRTSFLKDLIGFDKPGFFIEALLEKNGISHSVTIEFYPHKKKLQIDQTTYSNLHSLMGFVPVVIMTPEMKKIIDDGPLERRKFIDFLASQISRPYFESVTRYHKALKQKNAALKMAQDTHVWDQILANEWILIQKKRSAMIKRLNTLAQTHLSSNPHLHAILSLNYKTHFSDELLSKEAIMQLFAKNKSIELQAKTSLYGPHRDEIDILLNGKAAHQTASEGQKKMIVAALCFASADLLKETLHIDPLLLIDDYDAHFDHIRKGWIFDELDSQKQAFLTSPLTELKQNSTLFIENGKFSENIPLISNINS